MISALIPYRPDGAYRDEAWAWVRTRWELLLPDVELVVSDDGGDETQNPGHFNHPLAINRAAARASGDVFVIADADTAFDDWWILEAAALVRKGAVPWVLPSYYDKLAEAATVEALSRPPGASIDDLELEWRGESVSWSGQVVVPREGFFEVGGYDERYAKWGADDMAFGLSMDTLWGQHHRLEGSCYHLWHPAPLDETYGHDRHRRQYQLGEKYKAAAGDPAAMRKVRFGI